MIKYITPILTLIIGLLIGLDFDKGTITVVELETLCFVDTDFIPCDPRNQEPLNDTLEVAFNE